jgi:hypothetical protein
MNQPILVTGGSGTLGRGVVDRLLAADHQVRVLSRRPRPAGTPTALGWVTGELVSGRGLAAAVADVAVIVHCASNPLRPRVDIDGTRNLVEAARAAGIWHLIDISIVGVDRVPYRYYQAKLQAERLIQASGLPWTILRATQFHQLVLLGGGGQCCRSTSPGRCSPATTRAATSPPTTRSATAPGSSSWPTTSATEGGHRPAGQPQEGGRDAALGWLAARRPGRLARRDAAGRGLGGGVAARVLP